MNLHRKLEGAMLHVGIAGRGRKLRRCYREAQRRFLGATITYLPHQQSGGAW